MRKWLLFLLVSGVLSLRAQTSTYRPFRLDTAVWLEHYTPSGCTGVQCQQFNRKVIDGDTLINALVYRKVYQQSGTVGQCSGGSSATCFFPSGSPAYIGALRQDTLAKKVYYHMGHDTLLYDFDLQVGDTIPLSYSNMGMNGHKIVQKTDSVLIGSIYYKVFEGDTSGLSWRTVEGIGNSRGVLSDIFGTCDYSMDCFNGNTLAAVWGCAFGCAAVAGIEKINAKNGILLSPNPTTGIFSISFPESTSQIVVTNSLGQILAAASEFNGLKRELNISELQAGIYFVSVKTSQGTITRKIVKQ